MLSGLAAIASLLVLAAAPELAPAATFTVVAAGDDPDGDVGDGDCDPDNDGREDDCTLRAAIEEHNSDSSFLGNTIEFSLPGDGPQTIAPTSELPAVTADDLDITGGLGGDCERGPGVELDGSGAGTAGAVSGLTINAPDVKVCGLALYSWDFAGIEVFDPSISDAEEVDGVELYGNFLGTDANANRDLALRNFHGVSMQAPRNDVGVPGRPANLIVGNENSGVSLTRRADGSRVRNNVIGLLGGVEAYGNEDDGVSILGVDDVVVARNVISGNGWSGIELVSGPARTVIRGNLIGTDASGNLGVGNLLGVRDNGSETTIGGSNPAARNLISGNSIGVSLGFSATQATVQGNYIGTDSGGRAAVANEVGFLVRGEGSTIRENVISGQRSRGVDLGGEANDLVGNLIGTDASGGHAVPNGDAGITLGVGSGAGVNDIGGTGASEGNVIAFNAGPGVDGGHSAHAARIRGNLIGVLEDGSAAGNGGEAGVLVDDTDAIQIGGSTAAAANTIAHNAGDGVTIGGTFNDPVRNPVLRNSIHSNGGLGIDISDDGVTANDPGDGDSGVGNDGQNFPEIDSAVRANPTRVQGAINSNPSTELDIQFFSNPACDASGNGEGKTFLGETTVITSGAGNAAFDVTLPAVAVGHQITATATDPDGNTSEFSACEEVAPDTTPPDTSLDSAPPPLTASNGASFTFSHDEAGSSFQCRLDGSTFAPCTSPEHLSGLPDGAHTFRVRAVDPVGNVDPTPATHTWTVDTTGPALDLRSRRKRPLRRRVRLKVRCDENCAAVARGKLIVRTGRKKKFRLRASDRNLGAGSFEALKPKLTNRGRRKAKRALRHGGKVVARVVAIARDGLGNKTRSTRRIRLV